MVSGSPPYCSPAADLAEVRERVQSAATHLRFLQDNYVMQQLVKEGLLRGLTQSELAAALKVSKREISRYANMPYVPAAAAAGDPLGPERRALDEAFLTYVWGSLDAVLYATRRCREYDAAPPRR